jgi:hypothetical protein
VRRAAWTIGLCWLLAAAASAQQSASLPLELRWQAPPECGSEADVRAQLERIAHALPGYALAPLRAEARVDRQERLYALDLSTEHEGERGERKLEASDCPTLVRSMTLVLALAFGKGVELAQGAEGEATQSRAPADHATSTTPAAASDLSTAATNAASPAGTTRAAGNDAAVVDAVASDSSSAPQLSLLLGCGARFAWLPSVAFGASFGAELAGDAWSLALRPSLWASADTEVAEQLSARFDGYGAALQGCGHGPVAFLELALCGTSTAAVLLGSSQGAFEDETAHAPWLGLGVLASATAPLLFAISVRLEAELAASLARPRFVIAGYGPVHHVPLLTGQVGLAFVLTP